MADSDVQDELLSAVESLALAKRHLTPVDAQVVQGTIGILQQVLRGDRKKRKVSTKPKDEKAGDRWDAVRKLESYWQEAHLTAKKPKPAKWLTAEMEIAWNLLWKKLGNHPDPLAEAIRRVDNALNKPPEYWRGKSFGIGAVSKCIDQFATSAAPSGHVPKIFAEVDRVREEMAVPPGQNGIRRIV